MRLGQIFDKYRNILAPQGRGIMAWRSGSGRAGIVNLAMVGGMQYAGTKATTGITLALALGWVALAAWLVVAPYLVRRHSESRTTYAMFGLAAVTGLNGLFALMAWADLAEPGGSVAVKLVASYYVYGGLAIAAAWTSFGAALTARDMLAADQRDYAEEISTAIPATTPAPTRGTCPSPPSNAARDCSSMLV